jgi:hypothetical protein
VSHSSDNGNGHSPGRLPGVHDYSPREFAEKFGREHVPAAYYTLERHARAAEGEGEPERERVFISPVGEDLRHDISHGTDAVNHLLALLNFPAPLRAFVDCMVGLAGERTGWFEEYGVSVGRRARTGRDDCTDSSMERWVQRQKAKLRQWQFERNFELVEMKDGDFDREAGKNRPTKWRVPLVAMAAEVVLRARAKSYWARGPRHQSRALREAARELLTEDPEAPPVSLPMPRTLTDEELLNRALKTVETQLGVIRDVMLRNGGDPRALLEEKYAGWVEKMATPTPEDSAAPAEFAEGEEPAVEVEPPADEVRRGDKSVAPSSGVLTFPVVRRGRGDTDVAPSPSSHSPPVEGHGSANGDSHLGGGGLSREECFPARPGGRRVGHKVRAAMDELARRYPEPTPAMKRRGCVEVVWGDATRGAAAAEDALNAAMEAYARGEVDERGLESAWTGYVLSRARCWREMSPRPAKRDDVSIPTLFEGGGGSDDQLTGEG